jgi:IS5 family transposase
LESQLSSIHAKKQGEAAWPPLLVFKALLLQSWYGLIDPGLEKQLARDLMFRRFINLQPSEGVPANEHDSHALEKLLTHGEQQVYADKAYASAEHDRLPAKRNTGNRILHKTKMLALAG